MAVKKTTDDSAIVTWNTNEDSSSTVEYGEDISYGSSTDPDMNLVSNHEVLITNLNPNTLYHFKVVSADNTANKKSSGDFTFTTKNVKEMVSALLYSAAIMFGYVHQIGYGLFNGSGEPITVTKVEFINSIGAVVHTVAESKIASANHKGVLKSGSNFNWSTSFQSPPAESEVEGWRVNWYCKGSKDNSFIVTAQYSSR